MTEEEKLIRILDDKIYRVVCSTIFPAYIDIEVLLEWVGIDVYYDKSIIGHRKSGPGRGFVYMERYVGSDKWEICPNGIGRGEFFWEGKKIVK